MPGASNFLVRDTPSLWRTSPPAWEQHTAQDSRVSAWIAGALIIATISFNAVLCFVNTRGVPITEIRVMMAEALLIVGAFMACRKYVTSMHVLVLGAIVVYTVALAAIKYADVPVLGFDPKISRDLIIPVVFFLLGTAVCDVKAADELVLTATLIVIAFALFEYFFLDAFLKIFDIAEYYISRGTLAPSNWALEVSNGLMVSGFRPADQGRTLLPFLGDHRVSSLFLEPTTLGNFGMLVAMWAAVRSRMEGKLYFWTALGGLALLVLSDTRFDAYFLILAMVVLVLPPRLTTPVVFVLPFVTILALYSLAVVSDPYHGIPMVDGRGIYHRLLYSGRVLLSFDIYNWFGLKVSAAQTFDSGYGYLISNVGIIGFALLWTLFMSLKGSSRIFLAFRNMIGIYFATLLCISASQFTIKLAALLWFLLGVLSLVKDERRGNIPARKVQKLNKVVADSTWRSSQAWQPLDT
jgi:putative polymerase